jgi:ABC transporter DrrB family efflux protein
MTGASVTSARAGCLDGGRRERPGPGRLARDSLLIAGRFLRILRGNPARLIYPLLQPVLILVLFVSVMENIASSVGGTYREFLIPGIMIQNVVLTAPVTGLAIVRDADTGLADRFRSLPMSRGAVLIGRSLSDTVVFFTQALVMIGVGYLLGFHVRTGLADRFRSLPMSRGAVLIGRSLSDTVVFFTQALVMIGVGYLLGFHVRTGLAGIAGLVVVAVGFGTALGITCAWLALLIGDVETAERALFFPFIPLAFVSSAYAPVGRLAGWLQPIARVNPVSSAVGVVRGLAEGGPLAAAVIHLAAWTLVLAVVPGVLAVRRWQSSS